MSSEHDQILDVLMLLPADEKLAVMWPLLQDDFDMAFDIFCACPSDDLLDTFRNFYIMTRDANENNLSVLTKLAAVFAGETRMITEYDEICCRIDAIIAR